MIPIRDTIPSSRIPFVTWSIVIANTLFFFIEVSLPDLEVASLLFTYGLVPSLVISGEASLLTFVSSTFLHGSWMHLIGNMWILFIFGDNVEDILGHFRFAIYYILWGIMANLMQFIFMMRFGGPIIGASGAIAGVMGAYLWFFPSSRILTLIPLLFIYIPLYIPAYIYLIIWFFLQFFNGITTALGRAFSSVAWWAHVGGFIAGYNMARLFESRKRSVK